MTRKPAHKQAPAKAVAECPLLPVIKRMNELLYAADVADKERFSNHPYLINDQIETLQDYSMTLRAASFEGALFQLAIISDRTNDLKGQSETQLGTTERELPWLIYSIAAFLREFTGDTVYESPAINIHIPLRLDPMVMIKTYLKNATEPEIHRAPLNDE